ncbi:SusD/RagB family nutrient-binding outer membrane lipoprotein [Ekhidna sp. MALMAid0563]|uniref:SusD/RagB family nutrient-binding outer membrane lipoprotein n=1 Tax=Ekhidna sp. MALMAid0563 TaxID=3143937 RepID=UPI0032DF1354
MKKYKLNIVAVLLATLITVPSCDFGDTNVDPQSLSEVSLNLVLPSAIAQVGFNNFAVAARNPGIIMQYFEGTDAQQLQYTSYNMPDNTFNNLWRTGLYGGAMKDLDLIIKQAPEDNAPHYGGIAKILMAESLGLTTKFFGDAPYSNAFLGEEGVISPTYDTQEELFTAIDGLLSSALTDLQGPAGDIVPGADDLVFGGDIDAWIATAYALQARYAILRSEKGSSFYTDALTAVNNAYNAGFTSNSGNAEVNFDASANGANPFHQFHRDRSNTMVLASYFLGQMSGDPRLALIREPGTSNGFAPTTYWGRQESPSVIINYAELKFIEAEALSQTGGSGAEAAMKAGIAANMDQMGVDAEDRDNYLLTVSGSSLATIIGEKYKALYPQNIAWDDYRRTGFPAITPNADNAAGLNPGGDIPRRFIYPNSEKNLNTDNVNAAISNQGSDLMNETLWVFQ